MDSTQVQKESDESVYLGIFNKIDLMILSGCLILVALYLWSKRKTEDSPTASDLANFKMLSPQQKSTNDTSFVQKMKNTGRNIVIFYGSQTGTAEDFATRLAKESVGYGMKSLVMDPEDCNMEELKDFIEIQNSVAIFCMATYGEGDPTDNAQEFCDWLKNTEEQLDGLRFTVFGLGNKTYEHYNETGKFVDKRLSELGAERIYPLGLGDDDASIEEDFLTWKESLWITICERFGLQSEGQDVRVRQYKCVEYIDEKPDKIFKGEIGRIGSFDKQKPPFDAKNPFLAPITVNRELHQGGDRSCMHIELDITGSRMRYETGDHVAVFPVNDSELIARLEKRLSIDLDTVFTLNNLDEESNKKHPFPCPCSYRAAFSYYLDITHIPKTNVLRELAEYTDDEKDKEFLKQLASSKPEGKALYRDWIASTHRSIVDVLEDLPSLHVPAEHLCELLPRLQARYYSISSSPKLHPNSIHITAVLVDYKTKLDRRVKGVATSWLALKRPVGEEKPLVPIYVRRSQFRLPYKVTTPLVMVGPGTGLAPFRGFIQERGVAKEAGKPVGDMILYFGCRKKSEDFIYEDEIMDYQNKAVLKSVYTAFSRDQAEKVYVQNLMLKDENRKEIWSVLESGGHFYICGDARNMAREVLASLEEIICSEANMTKTQAQDYIKKMQNKGRYSADVWS